MCQSISSTGLTWISTSIFGMHVTQTLCRLTCLWLTTFWIVRTWNLGTLYLPGKAYHRANGWCTQKKRINWLHWPVFTASYTFKSSHISTHWCINGGTSLIQPICSTNTKDVSITHPLEWYTYATANIGSICSTLAKFKFKTSHSDWFKRGYIDILWAMLSITCVTKQELFDPLG